MYENAMTYANAMHEYDEWWMQKWYANRDAMKKHIMWSRKQGKGLKFHYLVTTSKGSFM